jgi:hypothetical protein
VDNYLIPANAKKSQLILGFFTPIDLAIFLSGCVISLALLLIFATFSLGTLIIMLMPLLIGSFLVLPVPHYHNILQLITNVINFFFKRRRYYWRGWDIYGEYDDSTNKRF